ncbi:MAG: rRNA large subunit methyltransferase I, partial [bacterium]
MAGLKLKPTCRARVLRGHPWVFAAEVQKLLPPSCDGEVVECRDARGRLLGSGIYNSRSKIIWRRFSRQKSELNKTELDALISRAIERRKPENVRRLVWSESDSLPGLVVDQYGETLAVQTLTLGMDRRLESIASILAERLRPACIVARNDAPTRKFEGLEEAVSVIYGKEPKADWLRIGDVEFFVDVMRGQKTGFYLDQREQYQAVAALAKNRR